jgi:hypothetical protein
MANNKEEKNKQELIKDSLESLLMNNNSSISPVNDMEKLKHPNARTLDIYAIKAVAEEEAKATVQSVIDLYLDKSSRKKSYVKEKRRVDESMLATIMFQSKMNEHSIIKIMEEIEMGNSQPRMFEVLARLQTEAINISKHQAGALQVLEESYKKVKLDNQQMDSQNMARGEDQGHLGMGEDGNIEDAKMLPEATPEGVKTRGTRNLMQSIQNIIDLSKQNNIEDVSFIDIKDDKPRLTNPHQRPESLSSNNISEDDGETDLDDEMFNS